MTTRAFHEINLFIKAKLFFCKLHIMQKRFKLLFFLIIYWGCMLSQDEYKDVANIFINRCTSCHHPEKTHPDFTNYSSINLYKTNISYNLTNSKMPPWPPDTAYSRFTHERIITLSEKTKILNWISNGALAGDTTLAPQAPTYPKTKLNGTPDLILTIPTYTSTATTTDQYICFSIPTGLTQDRILKAYEIVPGNASIVHHVSLTIDTIGNSSNDLSGNCFTNSGHISLGSYAPGGAPIVLPDIAPSKFGIRLKAGSKMILEMHYPEWSIGEVDSTQVRLYFYPTNEQNIRTLYVSPLLQNWTFGVAANTSDTIRASMNYPQNISVYSIFPHSHNICTSIKVFATDGNNTIKLCKINNWDFEWQGFYTFKNFIKIPNTYTLHAAHFFDNTTNNPKNTNPVDVSAGVFSSDEMLMDQFMFTEYQNGDENINIDSIIQINPLLNVSSVDNIEKDKIDLNIYPNPFSEKIFLKYKLRETSRISLEIYNTLGEEIYQIKPIFKAPGTHSIECNFNNFENNKNTSQIYLIKLVVNDYIYTKKIVLESKN